MDVYWLEQAEAAVPSSDDWLSPRETICWSGLRSEKRRRDWRLGRWTAKRALAAYWKLPPDGQTLARLEIRPAPSGAPLVFIADEPVAVTISLSHRAARASCAIAMAGAGLGCDVELIEPRSAAFAADYFTAEEQAFVESVSAPDRFPLLALLWSGKESALKALQDGLRLDLRCVSVLPADFPPPSGRHEWRPLHVRYTRGATFHGWWHSTGALVRTLVAVPPPLPPIALPMPAISRH